jgi:MoaA/NifB/PqqE/SkfB family radical SAM enzyme
MSHLARLASSAMSANIPMHALLELTGRCNLHCRHCYLDLAHPPPEMPTVQAMDVVDQLAEAGTLFLTLSGGEVLLRRDALAVAAHARERGLAVRLFTNATLVDRSIADAIARLSLLAVEVSIYGHHRMAHDGVTARRRSLSRTLRGVLYLVRAGVPVALKAPLLGVVTEDLDTLIALADRLHARPLKR